MHKNKHQQEFECQELKKDSTDHIKTLNNLPIYILVHDYQRSGSDFFNSLIDGHPEILQTTGSCAYDFVTFYNKWCKYSLDQIALMATIDPYLGPLFDSRLRIEERWDMLGPNRDQYFSVDKEKFIFNFINLMSGYEKNLKNIFIAFSASYMMSAGQSLSTIKIVFFHLHHISNWTFYKDSFKNANLIVTTRDPREGIVSYNLHRPKNDYFYLDSRPYVKAIKTYLNVFRKQQNFTTQHYMSLQDLHREPENVMKKFSLITGVKYVPEIMLVSSYHGLLWWGDAWSKKMNTFNPDFGTKKTWRKYFFIYELAVFEVIYHDIFDTFEYLRYDILCPKFVFFPLTPFLIFLPTKMEVVFFKHKNTQITKYKKILISIISYAKRVYMMQNAFFKVLYNLGKINCKYNRMIQQS